MAENSRIFHYRESGLSEVVGFVLILAVIIAAASIYMTYGIPAQGREKEILHMNEIRDQFVAYKIGVDALWINDQANTAMSTTFTLGTQGEMTRGSISVIPIMNPVGSSGTLALNQRGETLTLQSRGLLEGGTVSANTLSGSLTLNATPAVFSVNISDTVLTSCSDWTAQTTRSKSKRSVLVQEGQNWSVNVTVNPKLSNYYYCNSTDLTIDVTKAGTKTLQGYSVAQNILDATNYTVNLLDDAYGLNNYLAARPYPMTVTLTRYDSSSLLKNYSIVSYTDEYDQILTQSALTLGALEYSANNNYWIPQTYYYQNGGVFLQQDNSTFKLPPTITFSYNRTSDIVGVKVIELPFLQTSTGNLGGNSPAQVRTLMADINTLPFSETYNNTKWINLTISSGDTRALAVWYRYFNDTINLTAGVPDTYYTTSLSSTQAQLNIRGRDTTDTQYDLHVEGLRANLSATIQGG